MEKNMFFPFYGKKKSKNFTIILVNTFHSEHFSTIIYARYLPQSRNEMSMEKHPQYYWSGFSNPFIWKTKNKVL